MTSIPFAYTCPDCYSEGGTSIEEQALKIEDGKLHIFVSYECFQCYASWWQNITIELGKVLQNEVTHEVSNIVYDDDDQDDEELHIEE